VGAPVVAAYAAGQMFYFVATGDNTGAVTLNIDALGAKAVTRDGSVALAAGDIKSGEVVVVVYDGTRFQVVSQLNSAGDARFANVSIASSLYVGGVSTFVGNAGFSANVSIASALSVGGVAAITGATTIGGNLTLNGGTANGVLYLNGSKVATSGSALTFDGTTLATTGKFGITGSGAVPTASALQIGTNAAGSRWLYNVPTGGEHNFTENGTVLSWQNISSLGWLIGGSEQMRLTSTGLGIGTSSPAAKLHVLDSGSTGTMRLGGATFYGSIQHDAVTTGANIYNSQDTGGHLWQNSGSTVLTLSNGGNLGLGVTPSAWGSGKAIELGQVTGNALWGLGINSLYLTSNARWNGSNYVYTNNGAANLYGAGTGNGTFTWFTAASGTAGNAISFTQAMTLDASGALLVGTTTASNRILYTKGAGVNNEYFSSFENTNSSTPLGLDIFYSAVAPNSTGSQFLDCRDTGATRLQLRSNGGLANYSANDVNLSDERTKKDIVPLGSMWDKFKAIEIVAFKYKDQTHEDNNIGVIAQQVESVAPEFVDVDGFGDTPEDGVPLKTVYTTDMYHAAIKALQEAMTRIEQLEAKVATLESK
jgi:hypothetical protein